MSHGQKLLKPCIQPNAIQLLITLSEGVDHGSCGISLVFENFSFGVQGPDSTQRLTGLSNYLNAGLMALLVVSLTGLIQLNPTTRRVISPVIGSYKVP